MPIVGTVSLPIGGPFLSTYQVGTIYESEFKWSESAVYRGWADVVLRLPDNSTNAIQAKDVRDPLWTLWNLVGLALQNSGSGATGEEGPQGDIGIQGKDRKSVV